MNLVDKTTEERITVREARAFAHAGFPQFDSRIRRKYAGRSPSSYTSFKELTEYLETLIN